jgi:hypothetical protein
VQIRDHDCLKFLRPLNLKLMPRVGCEPQQS